MNYVYFKYTVIRLLETSHYAHPARQYSYSLSPAPYLAHTTLSCCSVKEYTLPARTAVYHASNSKANL